MSKYTAEDTAGIIIYSKNPIERWATDIVQGCLREAAGDVVSGLRAASYILGAQAGPDIDAALGWVTVGGHPEGNEQHKDGTAIFIDNNGNVTKGPASLVGKRLKVAGKSSANKSKASGSAPPVPSSAPAPAQPAPAAPPDGFTPTWSKTIPEPEAKTPTQPQQSIPVPQQPSSSSRITSPKDSKTFKDFVTGANADRELLNLATNSTTMYGTGRDPQDDFMGIANKETGYDAKPQLVSKDELDKYISGGGLELYRGVGGKQHSSNAKTQFVEKFKNGDFYAGIGVMGNGTYATIQRQEDWDKNGIRSGENMAAEYAGKDAAGMIRMSIKKEAKITTKEDTDSGIAKYLNNLNAEYEKAIPERQKEIKREAEIISDPGRYAQLHGYDVIMIRGMVVVLNRGMLIVQKDPVALAH